MGRALAPLVLLCYENVHRGEVCHRRMAAEWIEQRSGLVVPEVEPAQLSLDTKEQR